MAQFLSDEYMAEATSTLNGHAGFANAISNVDLDVQFMTQEAPEGDIPFYLSISDGNATLTRGNLDDADVTLTYGYDTAVGIFKGDVNTQMAFMTGKIKVAGNMAKLMMNQAVFNQFATALSSLDIEA